MDYRFSFNSSVTSSDVVISFFPFRHSTYGSRVRLILSHPCRLHVVTNVLQGLQSDHHRVVSKTFFPWLPKPFYSSFHHHLTKLERIKGLQEGKNTQLDDIFWYKKSNKKYICPEQEDYKPNWREKMLAERDDVTAFGDIHSQDVISSLWSISYFGGIIIVLSFLMG